MRNLLAAMLLPFLLALPAQAADTIPERAGWAVHPTAMTYDDLVARMPDAIASQGMGKVTEAGPTGAARARGIEIPGSRVFGVFNNDYAVRIIGLSLSAMIEAPVRIYVTEGPDGTATLSYKLPSTVFAPYADEAGPELAAIAADLDAVFARIAEAALAR